MKKWNGSSDELTRWLERVPERLVVCDDGGHILWLNSLAEFLLGRPGSELEGTPLHALVVDADDDLLQRLHAVGRGEGIRSSLIHATGTHLRVELASSGSVDGHSIVVIRPLEEQPLDERARTYELVFEGAPVGIFHFDALGAVTACNDAFVKILGSPRRVLLGVRIDTLPDLVMRRCMRDTLAGQRAHYEGEYKSATSGQVRSVRVAFAPITDTHGAVIGGVGIAEDVTERKRAEQAFRTLIEQAPDAIAVHRGDRFLLVNPALVRLLGHATADELLARRVDDVVRLEEADPDRAWHVPGGRAKVALRREIRLRRADGETVTTEIASIEVEYDGGPAQLSFARDVTARRALEARLAVADRLASVGTLAAGIAHEINNPLAYVMLNLGLLRRDPTIEGAHHVELDRAWNGCDRMRVIIRDLRIFSRAEEDRRAPVDVRGAIDSAINFARNEIQARARLVRDTPPVPHVLADEARLTQVILNLLLNAAQAIPAGDPSHNTIRVTTGLRDGRVEISVGDTGEGIPHDQLSRIFEPFWTTKPVGIGTGLGLSIVHGIVDALGGRIEVDSQPRVGSTFRVLLPPVSETVITSPSAPPEITAPVPRSRILLIDDEALFVEALRDSLLRDDHDVVVETSGRAGLARLLSDPFDLVVCDLKMPEVSGVTILELARDERPDLLPRLVLMTGGAYGEDDRALFDALGVRVLEKPFQVAELEHILGEMHAEHGA